jgi:hypothetical protein
MSWLCACEQAHAQALTSALVASQLKNIIRGKTPFATLTKKQLRMVEMFFRLEKPMFFHS